jgi:hypothetical protein
VLDGKRWEKQRELAGEPEFWGIHGVFTSVVYHSHGIVAFFFFFCIFFCIGMADMEQFGELLCI